MLRMRYPGTTVNYPTLPDHSYAYKALDKSIGAETPMLSAESYSYDPVGNRLTSATANNWTYNPNNELQSYNGVSFQYDLNGNTTQKTDNGAIQNFLYNEDDRLTEIKDGTGTIIATYYYDPFRRRLWKEVGGPRTYFMYADEGLIAEFDGLGAQPKAYGYAPNSTWTTNPLFMKQGPEYYFYHNDHLGTPQKMTSVSGAVVWSAKYESFGKAEVDPGSTVVNNLRLPGQYYDQETGLHYNFHRYFLPMVARYFRTDPLGFNAGPNCYTYAFQNPVNLTDPFGLRSNFRPPIPFPGAQELIGAPGDDEPPKGTVIPFHGETYIELYRYTLEHFRFDGVIRLQNDVDRLVFPASLKVPCREVKRFDLCFQVSSMGVFAKFIKEQGKPAIYSLGIRCVSIDVIGIMGCKCIEDLMRQPQEEGLYWRQGR